MPDLISPESLPDWPRKDIEAEEATILACLLGKHGKKPLTGPLGDALLLREVRRHDKEFVNLVTAQTMPKDNPSKGEWHNNPISLFDAPTGFIAEIGQLEIGQLDIPTLSLKPKLLDVLTELVSSGQPSIEFADIEKLEAMGIFKKVQGIGEAGQSRAPAQETQSTVQAGGNPVT